MKTLETIRGEQSLIEELFMRIGNSKIPIERSVIVEKYKEPISDINYVQNTEAVVPDDEYFYFLGRLSNYTTHTLAWYNSNNQLHNFNDNPSKITWNNNFIEIEWYKNGEPYRKNSRYNKIIITNKKESYSANLESYVSKEINTVEFQLFNRKKQLHSFNDKPAVISENQVSWYWNGKRCRNSYGVHELPSSISQFGHLTFQRINEDSPETVQYPLSKKYYKDSVISDLRGYEKYVQWPIRELFTL